ncbi:hypothetical protein IE53DRAFT_368653 [Violaceomyces palustris]|uniref:Uncharacterized protein n=1 Tax=Violaceomyces palustris TaxID=1673888 RepID=A0ACD0NYA1_9BASI|nr:hypothetical protein IE53DRAFT_368653 [Violaceomyces palustris]
MRGTKPIDSDLFGRLPPEVVDHIPWIAANLQLTSTLFQWCLVSRKWHKIVLPCLYRCIAFRPPYEPSMESHLLESRYKDGSLSVQDDRSSSFYKFCTTLELYPHLGELVKAIDFPVSRRDKGIANQWQYEVLLLRCKNLIYLRNRQIGGCGFSPLTFHNRLRGYRGGDRTEEAVRTRGSGSDLDASSRMQHEDDEEEDADDFNFDSKYFLNIPPGSLPVLQWVDTDIDGYEEIQESVFRPFDLKFKRDMRMVQRWDCAHSNGERSAKYIAQLRNISNLAFFGKIPMSFRMVRKLVNLQLPMQRFIITRNPKRLKHGRFSARTVKAGIRLVDRTVMHLQLLELHFGDHFGWYQDPDTNKVTKRKLYPRSWWKGLLDKVSQMAPLRFAVAIFHDWSDEVGDFSGWDKGEIDQNPVDVSDGELTDYEYDSGDDESMEDDEEAEDGAEVDEEAAKRARRGGSSSCSPSSCYTSERLRRKGMGSGKERGWQKPMILLPNTKKWVEIKLEGGIGDLPFIPPSDPPPWELLVNPPEYLKKIQAKDHYRPVPERRCEPSSTLSSSPLREEDGGGGGGGGDVVQGVRGVDNMECDSDEEVETLLGLPPTFSSSSSPSRWNKVDKLSAFRDQRRPSIDSSPMSDADEEGMEGRRGRRRDLDLWESEDGAGSSDDELVNIPERGTLEWLRLVCRNLEQKTCSVKMSESNPMIPHHRAHQGSLPESTTIVGSDHVFLVPLHLFSASSSRDENNFNVHGNVTSSNAVWRSNRWETHVYKISNLSAGLRSALKMLVWARLVDSVQINMTVASNSNDSKPTQRFVWENDPRTDNPDSFVEFQMLPKPSISTVHPQIGFTDEVADAARSLLQYNHETFHIFFNDLNHHNHLVHHVLSAISLGVDAEYLPTIYKHAFYALDTKFHLNPKPSKGDPDVKAIDSSNWKGGLNNRKHYWAYLSFFDEQLKGKSLAEMGELIEEYVFGYQGDGSQMISRFIGGAVHPLIHTGYGLEFNMPGIVAEGLSMTCISDSHFSDLLPSGWDVQLPQKGEDDGLDVFSITALMGLDPDLAPGKEAKFPNMPPVRNIYQVLKGKGAQAIVTKYAPMWKITEGDVANPSEDGKGGWWNKFGELAWLNALFLGATAKPGCKKVHDFFLARAKLLQAHFRQALAFWIAQGRPVFEISKTLNATPLDVSAVAKGYGDGVGSLIQKEAKDVWKKSLYRNWSDTINIAAHHLDEHTVKAIRTLSFLSSKLASTPRGTLKLDDKVKSEVATTLSQSSPGDGKAEVWRDLDQLDGTAFLRTANQLFESQGFNDQGLVWSFDGAGFDETWGKKA